MAPDPTRNPAPSAPQATVREFLSVVFRRRMVIFGLFVATTATVVWIAFSTPLEYSSSGRVLVRRGEKESVFDAGRQVVGGWEEELSSELQVVRSVPVLQRAREFLGADSDSSGATAIEISPKKVDAEVVGKSNVVAIGYSDGDPIVARRVCEAVIRAYIEFRTAGLSLANPRQFFETELAKVKGDLDRKVEARRRFANEAGVSDLSEERRHLLSRLSNLNDRQDQTAAELAEARTARQRMEELKSRQNLDIPTSASFTNENALVVIKSKMIDQQVRLTQLRERYRDDSPDVVAAANTLDTLRQMLSREIDARVTMWDSRIEVLESRQKVFESDQAGLKSRLDPMMDKETQLGTLERDISLLRARYEDLVRRSDQARLTEKTSVSINLVLLSPAGPALPNNSRDYARLALAPAFSLVVGLGLAFFFDGVDVTVHSPSQAEEAAQLPVLAAIRERRRKGLMRAS